MMYTVLHIFFLLIYIYLSVNVLYFFLLSVSGLFGNHTPSGSASATKKIAVLITSYKEDKVIVETVRSAVSHDYPAGDFKVHLAADQLQPETIRALQQTGADVNEVHFSSGSKAKSLNFLLNRISEDSYDVALVLDGDNIMAPGFLKKVNAAFQAGTDAVQGHRTAKNTNTSIAVLDAISEEVNNHLFRRAQNNLGFSASLIGSGMAFPFNKLKEVYNKPGILDNPACDREVDYEMMSAGIKVKFLDDALVLDEKVATESVYENQRRRWLESQLMHLRLFFSEKRPTVKKTSEYWYRLFITLLPPRIFFIVIFLFVFCFSALDILTRHNFTNIPLFYWIILFVLYASSIFIAIPRKYYSVKGAIALFSLPLLLFSMIKAAITMRFNRKEFVHTPKTFTGDSRSTGK